MRAHHELRRAPALERPASRQYPPGIGPGDREASALDQVQLPAVRLREMFPHRTLRRSLGGPVDS